MKIPIDQIIPDPNQPRKTFDDEAIKELASSFESYGIISPLKVRPYGDNQYMIITGELRYRAAKQRGDKEIEVGDPIEVTDQQAREMQFIENLHRSDIPPLELGEAFYNHRKEHRQTQQQLADILGKSDQFVRQLEMLYTNLPISSKSYLQNGDLAFAVALDVARVEGQARQEEFTNIIMGKQLGKAETQKIATKINAEPDRPVADIVDDVLSGKAKQEEMARLEAAKRAAGITIETPEELNRAAEALKKEARRKAKEAMTPEEKAEEERKKLVAEARKSLASTLKKIDRASKLMGVSEFRERLTTLEEAFEKDPAEAKAQLTGLAEEVTEAEKRAEAETKRLKDEERKRKKVEKNQKREEHAEKKVRKQLLENHSFLGEVLAKAPTELIEERIYTPEQREILKKPPRPTTQWDRFNELAKLADKLSNGLAELPQIPAFARMTLGITLQSLRARIDETLERMGMQGVEMEVKRIREG